MFANASGELVVPPNVTFADLELTYDLHSRAIGCERSALAAVCAINDLDENLVFSNEEVAGWMIAQWYRLHRDRGGPRDRVAEALLNGLH